MENKTDYHIFLVAGIKTSDRFFDPFARGLHGKFTESGSHSRFVKLFPYGKINGKFWPQVWQVRRDLHLPEHRTARSAGGQKVRQAILRHYDGHGKIIIIGHSGGGVAGYHAGKLLESEDGVPVMRIVQIGSPKVRIAPPFQEKVLFFAAHRGRFNRDPVTHLGTWAGGFLNFRRTKYAPKIREKLNIIGDHKRYFDAEHSYKDGVSNLQKSVEKVWDSLNDFWAMP